MKNKKVVITGMGCVSAAGKNSAETLQSFEKLKINCRQTTLFATNIKSPVFEVDVIFDDYQKTLMRTAGLVIQALKEAIKNRGNLNNIEAERIGVCLGTTVASQLNDMDFYKKLRLSKKVGMESVNKYFAGNIAQIAADYIGAKGPKSVVVNACSSSADAIGVGLSWIRSGMCDMVIAGGGDELSLVPLSGFHSLGVMSPNVCAPFDKDRQGLNLGEGAGIMILENEEKAKKSGADYDMYLAGYGSACDAYHLTAPKPDGSGLIKAVQICLEDAGIKKDEICFVNAHGTATRDNDKVEGMALEKLFSNNVKVLSTKGYTGHTLGAAGVLEAIFTALALRNRWVPASAGFINKDSEIPIAPLKEKTSINGRYAISTSLAFGGNNSAIIIGRCE